MWLCDVLIPLPSPGFVPACALAHCKSTRPRLRLFGCYWLLFFFPFFPLCPANPVTSPEVAEVVIPAKGTGAHRAFCPQSARLGPGTNGSFPLLLLRRHHQGGVWPWKLVREMHNVKEDLQSEMLEGRWEKGRNGQGQIWRLRAREQHSLMGPGEPQRLEVPDLNKEVFSLVRQAWVSLGCLVEQGACQGMETFLETPLGPSLPLSFHSSVRHGGNLSFPQGQRQP